VGRWSGQFSVNLGDKKPGPADPERLGAATDQAIVACVANRTQSSIVVHACFVAGNDMVAC
jgi:hypothetical protein